MSAIGLSIQHPFDSGCAALHEQLAKVAARWRETRAYQRPSAPKDFCLYGPDGNRLGMVPAAAGRPRLGADQPTIYLHRDD
jgi:hypothetical protein